MLYTDIRIRLHVVIRIGSVSHFVCVCVCGGGGMFEESSCVILGVLLVASASSPDRTMTSGELGDTKLSLSPNSGLLYSHSHALAYKSSCLMMISGSGCHSRGVTGMSGFGCRGVN